MLLWDVGGHIESIVQLLIDDFLIQLVQFPHEFALIKLHIVASAHDLLDLLLVCHQVSQVVIQVLHLVHVQGLHLLLLHSH